MNTSVFQVESLSDDCLYLMNQQKTIQPSEVILMKADVNYTHIYLQDGKKVLISKTLKTFVTILANHQFYRIHRAIVINGKHLQQYDEILGEVLLTNNYRAVASRRRKVIFKELISEINS